MLTKEKLYCQKNEKLFSCMLSIAQLWDLDSSLGTCGGFLVCFKTLEL